MISASTASLPHSEAILSSAAFSSSLASSLEQQPRSQRHRQRPHRASFDSAPPPPLRSVDVTEAPHNDSDGVASSVSSPRGGGGSENNVRGSALDVFRGASTANRGGGAGGGGARQQDNETKEEPASQAAPRQQYTSTSDSDRSTSYTEEASALSATSSPSISSSELLEEDAGDSAPTAASSSSPPSATSPERLLALLTPEQLETALELYVDHGGIHADDVPLMLTKLPWHSAPTYGQPSAAEAVHHEKVRKKGKNSESGASALLDPEAWLCAVAVAVAAAKGSDTGRCADKKEDGTTAALSTLTQQQQQTFQDRYEASSIVLGQSGGNGSASQYLALKSNAPAAAPLRSGHSPTPTGRKLAFMEEEGEEEEEEREERPFYWVPSQTRASLPELQPRPPSSSLRSQVSPTPLPLSPRPPPASQHNQPQQPQKQVAAAVPNTTTTSTSSSSRRPPRSSARPRSPRFSSVSPEAQHGVDAPHTDRGVSPFSTGAEDAGMRLLFQQCLRTPLAAATSMLSESDWVALVAELRREGHHKLPPQAILDDVTQTISAEVQRVRRPGGLNVADVARILHRQMDEVRTDLTTASSVAGTHEGGGAAVEFPAHPRYLIMVATSNNNSAGASRTHRASVSFSSSVRWPSALGGGSSSSSGGGGWRVLPTWCMALAGLFPVEMSAICPVPVVRYLRSVGLMHAVLEAMVQRLDLEVEAMPEATSVSTSSVAASAHHENNRGLQLRLRDVEPSSAAPSSSVQGIPSPTGVSGFIWPPRSHTPTSFPVSGAGFSSAARPASSLAPASAVSHNDSGSWREKPEWRPMLMGGVADSVGDAVVAAVLPTAATASTAMADGDGLFAPDTSAANVSVDKVRGGKAPTSPATRTLSAGTRTSVRPSTSVSRLHDERPVDEIRASVVARAKARRLMDSLRRNTVPINRYECFARVEHEDEPVQEPLCFVSKEELRQTLGHSSSDDGEGSQDSDALSDLIGTLTYDPAAAAAAQEAEARRIQQQQQQQLSPDGHGGKPYVELLNRVRSAGHRSSLRPPQLPPAAAANVVPNVFSGPSRASVLMLRARTASTRGNSAGAAAAAAAVGTPLGITEVEHRPPPLPPPPPPPPVPGMYRMTGVLLGALPKQQEEALVERLSHPVFDPRTMGLRAASAGAVRPTVAKGSRRGKHATTSTASGEIKSDAKDQPARAQSAGVRPPAAATTANDSVCLSDDSAVMEQPTATPPLDTTHLSSATKNSVTPPRLTNDQHRGFYCFDVPAVLVAQPLSTVAAAAAAAQVIEAAATSPHALAPQPPARTAAEAVGAVARQRGGGRRRHAPLHTKHTATTATHPLLFTAAASRACSAGKGRCPQQPYAAAAAAAGGAAATRVSARRTASSHASRCTPRRSRYHQQQQRGLTPTPEAAHRSEMTAARENSGKRKTKGRARRGKKTAGEASPGTVHRVKRPDGFGYASEVPRTRRVNGSAHDGDTRAFVSLGGNDSVHGVSNSGASASVSHRTDPNGPSPPPVPMSLFERRLLRQLQRAYTLESGGGGGSGRGGGVGGT